MRSRIAYKLVAIWLAVAAPLIAAMVLGVQHGADVVSRTGGNFTDDLAIVALRRVGV